MANIGLTLACGDYDRTRALRNGLVALEGVDLTYLAISPPHEMFYRQLHYGEFDASELSLSNYIMSVARNEGRFIAIPAFPSRTFRHSDIWINTSSGIREPQDLAGKRIGCPEYAMTAMLWVRGLLQDEYGVAPSQMTWYLGRADRAVDDLPSGIEIQTIPPGASIDEYLERGEIDVLATTRPPSSRRRGVTQVRRLFPDQKKTEATYFRKTGIYPIMHVVALRRDVYDQHRWLARTLLKAFQAAKERCYQRLWEQASLESCLPWAALDWEETVEVLGPDPYVYGAAANRKALEAATRYSYEQGLSPRLVAVDELFAPETVD